MRLEGKVAIGAGTGIGAVVRAVAWEAAP